MSTEIVTEGLSWEAYETFKEMWELRGTQSHVLETRLETSVLTRNQLGVLLPAMPYPKKALAWRYAFKEYHRYTNPTPSFYIQRIYFFIWVLNLTDKQVLGLYIIDESI